MATTLAEVQVALGLVGTNTVVGGLREVDQGLQQIAHTSGGFNGIDTQQLFGGLEKLGTGMLTAGTVGAAGLGLAVKAGVDFQQSIANIGAVSGASASDLARLSATAQQLALDTTLSGVGATDASRAMAELAKAGLSVDDIIGGAARGALLLGSAAGLDFAQAATIAADTMHQFGLAAADVPHIADVLQAAANASSIDVTDLALSLKYVAPAAHDMGISLEETVGTLAELGNAGIKADTAGTGLRTMLVNLVNPTKQMKAVMQEYGLSFFDASGHIKDFAGISDELHSKLAGLTDQQRLQALETLFGKESLSTAIVVYDQGGDAIRNYTAQVDKAGAAAESGAQRNNTANGALNQLKDTAEALAITLGTIALPALTDLAKGATELLGHFQQLTPEQQKLAVEVAAGATGFLLLGGSVIKVTGNLRDLYSTVGDVIGAFGKKEAAKKSLTAANEVLAGSAGNTAKALGAEGLGASGAAVTLADLAVTSGVFVVASYGVMSATDGVQKKFGEQNDIVAQNATRWDAAALAMSHGATEQNGLIDGFQRYLSASGLVIADQNQLTEAWNRYVYGLQGAMISTQGVTRAFEGTMGPLNAMNDRLGMGRNELAQYNATGSIANDTFGRLAVGAAAMGAAQVAAEPPTRATGAALAELNTNGTQAQATMNDNASAAYALAIAQQTVAPTIGYTALGMKDVDYYGTAAQTRMNETATAAYAAATAFDAANKSLSEYSKQGSQMQGYKTTLQKEFDDLIAKRDGTKLSDVDAKRLADDQAQLRDLDAKSGQGPLSAADQQRRNDLRAEIAGLQAKVKAGTPLTEAETARLNVIAPEIDYLNAKGGENTAATNQATSNAVEALINSNNANDTANAANNAAASAPPAQLGTPGGLPKDFAPPINASDISKYDEFGQPYAEKGKGIDTSGVSGYDEFGHPYSKTEGPGIADGVDYKAMLTQALAAAAQPRTITAQITVNGVAPKDIAQEIYNELEPLLAPTGAGGTVGVGAGPF